MIPPGDKPRKKRKRFGNLEREETAETRQIGACMACRVQKERVSYLFDTLPSSH